MTPDFRPPIPEARLEKIAIADYKCATKAYCLGLEKGFINDQEETQLRDLFISTKRFAWQVGCPEDELETIEDQTESSVKLMLARATDECYLATPFRACPAEIKARSRRFRNVFNFALLLGISKVEVVKIVIQTVPPANQYELLTHYVDSGLVSIDDGLEIIERFQLKPKGS